MHTFLVSSVFSFLGLISHTKTVSPFDYGFNSAKNGQERYEVIYKTHKAAQEIGGIVSYAGIDKVDIEIPRNAKTIPLTRVSDFNNVTFNVLNKEKDIYLFTLLGEREKPLSISKESLTTYNFKRNAHINKGLVLLIVKDDNPWVENRSGHNYGAIRKDVLLLNNGKSINKTIVDYNNIYSSPSVSYVYVTKQPSMFQNITFNRDSRSTFKTLLVKITNTNNVKISNVTISTPPNSDLRGDAAISIMNCTNVQCRNFLINNTYSANDYYGYGILMDNVWNSFFDRIKSDCRWGVFGNNNINKVEVRNSDINRFDVHCYGKDFSFYNCKFRKTGVPQSSMYGLMQFKDCMFDSAISCMYRSDYNAYTPFSLVYEKCVFNLDKQHNCLVYTSHFSAQQNSRPELSEKSLPNLRMTDCVVNLDSGMTQWEVFHIGDNNYPLPVSNISTITIDGLTVRGAEANLIVFGSKVLTKEIMHLSLSRVNLLQKADDDIDQATSKYLYYPSVIYNVNPSSGMNINVQSSRLNYNAIDNSHYNISFTGCTLGQVRYYNAENTTASTRREYRNCLLLLNCNDDNDYLIDANADYISCTFKPCVNSKKIIPMSMEDGATVTFERCKVLNSGQVFLDSQSNNKFLRNSQYNVSTKVISRKVS